MYLDRIVTTKQTEVQELQARISIAEMEKAISGMGATLGFHHALRTGQRNRRMGLIAEVKKASPSKGLIREDFHPVELARSYEAAGADCLSVLTDIQYFQGSNEFLQSIRQTVKVPILRKDFTIDVSQIYEARMIGADAVLLIAAILSNSQMKQFIEVANSLGLDCLVEVHDREELERALELDARLIGINNRNLKTFVTDLKTTEELLSFIPKDYTIISESGISKSDEIAHLTSVGVDGVLVGEHFMRQTDVGKAVADLLGPISEEVKQ